MNVKITSPYIGLRFFYHYKSVIFFGRDSQIKTLQERLSAFRFTAIVGASGSGKSSLVKAILLPKLNTSEWLIAECHSIMPYMPPKIPAEKQVKP
jgi:AAA15 family ATPase/GTPase